VTYAAPGYLLFSRSDANSGVWALPFSEHQMDLSKAVLVEPEARGVDAAEDGTLLLLLPSGTPTGSEFFWVDRNGSLSTIPGAPVELHSPIALSPDAHHAVFVGGSAFEIFLRDLATGTDTRLTFDAVRKSFPTWFPSGDRILYSISRAVEATQMVVLPADGTGDAREFGPGDFAKISADGRQVIYLLDDRGRVRLRHAPILPGGSLGPPQHVFTSDDEPDVTSFDLSPDGNLIAYTAVTPNSGPDVFLTQFPTGHGRWQVSSGTPAFMPRFSHDGRELFYLSGSTNGKLMAAPITSQPSVKLGQAAVLLDMTKREATGLTGASYNVSPDGRRFLMARKLQSIEGEGPRLIVLQNWLEELKQRAPVK